MAGAEAGTGAALEAELEPSRSRRADPSPRGRIVNAMIAEAGLRGLLEVRIEDVIARAGVDRVTFDSEFDGRLDCFLDSWDVLVDDFNRRCMAAYARGEGWRGKLRAAAEEFLNFLEEDPLAGRTLILEILNAGPKGVARRDLEVRMFAALVDAGRAQLDDPESIPRVVAEGISASIYDTIYSHMLRRDGTPRDLMPQMVCMAVMPYLGVDAALAEL